MGTLYVTQLEGLGYSRWIFPTGAPEETHRFGCARASCREGREGYVWSEAGHRERENEDGFSKVVTIDEVLKHKANLNMALYVSNVDSSKVQISLDDALANWQISSKQLSNSMDQLFKELG